MENSLRHPDCHCTDRRVGAWKVFTPYQPDETAAAALAEVADAVKVNEQEHWVGFEPVKEAELESFCIQGRW